MQTIIFILTCLFSTTFLFGQTDETIKVTRKTVETINTDTGYTVMTLNNDYFVNEINVATDGGQDRTGYYKNGQIKKLIYANLG